MQNLTTNLLPEVKNIHLEDRHRLLQAIELSRQCEPVNNAFSVGAIVFDAKGKLISTGYSREEGDRSHAEEVAILRANKLNESMVGGTIYSSLEPCGERASSNKTCTERIIEAGIVKVVFAMREPHTFVTPASLDRFLSAGIQLVQISDLESEVLKVNKHLLSF